MRDNGTLRFLLGDHLSGTNVTTTDAGAFLASLRYHPWGSVRYANGTTPTKYQFTGQYSFASEFGLIDFKARYYDPQLGRFAAPDSVIPGAGNPQAWDRYAGMMNNPVRYTDPSGHKWCDSVNEGDCKGGSGSGWWGNLQLYNYMKREQFDSPNPSTIANAFAGTKYADTVMNSTLGRYEEIRRAIFLKYGWGFVNENGKIDDQALIAIIIQMEFGNKNGEAFGEALEGLSRQYFSEKTSPTMTCHEACTLSDQIAWMTNMEGFRHGTYEGWESMLDEAALAMDQTYQYGSARDSWFWGNVPQDRLSDFSIVYRDPVPDSYGWFFIVYR